MGSTALGPTSTRAPRTIAGGLRTPHRPSSCPRCVAPPARPHRGARDGRRHPSQAEIGTARSKRRRQLHGPRPPSGEVVDNEQGVAKAPAFLSCSGRATRPRRHCLLRWLVGAVHCSPKALWKRLCKRHRTGRRVGMHLLDLGSCGWSKPPHRTAGAGLARGSRQRAVVRSRAGASLDVPPMPDSRRPCYSPLPLPTARIDACVGRAPRLSVSMAILACRPRDGVTDDGQAVWCSAGDRLGTFDPATGKVAPYQVRKIHRVEPRQGRLVARSSPTASSPGSPGSTGVLARHLGR